MIKTADRAWEHVTSADLAGIYKDVAETVGIDNAYAIYLHFPTMKSLEK